MKGFSLVELLISLSVIGLILAIGTVGYRDFTRRQQVTTVANQMIADLRLAQQQALSGYRPNDGMSGGCNGTLQQYEVNRVSNSQYTVSARCNAQIVIKTVDLPAGVTMDAFSPSPPGGVIGFRPVTQQTNLSQAVNTTIRASSTATTQQITISPAGDIR